MRHLTTLKLIDAVTRFGSIRRAADEVALTPSALHRRIQTFEEEIGGEIFERLPGGVRLNAAGELVVDHIRRQIAETERLKSRLADLAGMRRGHISIACSQALTSSFLPKAISEYRRAFPQVTFEVIVADHAAAEKALIDYEVDLALVFDWHQMPEFEVMLAVRQDLRAVMARTHPLARENELRLRQCLEFPLALPTKAYGGRLLLEDSVARSSMQLTADVESTSFDFLKSYVLRNQAITFQIPVGTPADDLYEGLVSVPIAPRDIRDGFLYLGQRRGRALSVASARFADQLVRELNSSFDTV
ncbi:MAG: LysR substrate-binding domain-containing protein [Pseudomonadota bacterium]